MSSAKPQPNTDFEDLIIPGFYLPSEGLTVRIANRIEYLEKEANGGSKLSDGPGLDEDNSADLRSISHAPASDSPEEIMLQRRIIAEELDGCLVDSAETDEALRGEKLEIQSVVTEGMSDALGLDVSDSLLTELSNEFRNWIDEVGSHTGSWGEIISAPGGYMYLKAFPDIEEPSFKLEDLVEKPSSLFARLAAKLRV